MRKIRRELANHGLSGYICLGILELVQMPGTEPRTLFVDALTRGAQIAYHLGRRLQLELESPHSHVMQLAHGLKRIKTGVPVPGYEALLISAGSPPVEARLMARAIHLCGERVAQENRVERRLASALRKLARTAGRSTLVISRQAQDLRDLLANDEACDALNRACQNAARPELATELLDLLPRAIARELGACQKLPPCAEWLIAYLPDPRGRPLSVATSKHELLLDELHYRGAPRAFTWDGVNNAFVDPATRATRTAIGGISFDPRPASRRFKRSRS